MRDEYTNTAPAVNSSDIKGFRKGCCVVVMRNLDTNGVWADGEGDACTRRRGGGGGYSHEDDGARHHQ